MIYPYNGNKPMAYFKHKTLIGFMYKELLSLQKGKPRLAYKTCSPSYNDFCERDNI